jgi:membrane protein YdbS with pleckstrin-like domain
VQALVTHARVPEESLPESGLPAPVAPAPAAASAAAPAVAAKPAVAAPTGDGGPQTASPDVPPATDPLAGDTPLERHRLSPLVTRYWRWRAVFSAVPVLVLLVGLAIVVPWGPAWLRWSIVGVVVALAAIGIAILPPIRYQVFWYAISPTEIDIQHGIIFIKRSVVPMHRVQTLRTERGPMADHYRMTNLKIKTAAGSVTISGLDRGEADVLCDRISRLADVADDV